MSESFKIENVSPNLSNNRVSAHLKGSRGTEIQIVMMPCQFTGSETLGEAEHIAMHEVKRTLAAASS